jgi:thioredoxin reductase (NADPH)
VAVVGQVTRLREELSLLSNFASKISVFSPSGSFDEGSKAMLGQFEKATPIIGSRIESIPDGPIFSGMMVAHIDGMTTLFECDALFVYLSGNRPVTDYIVEPLEKEVNGCIKVGKDGSTSIDGVFAVGDMTCREVRQVSLAVAEGMNAALSARARIDGSKVVPQWGERGG